MPFVKKSETQVPPTRSDGRNIFIGRAGELLFFVQHILEPEDPTYNIVSVWGQGGVGKSTLLARLIDEARASTFKDYCLIAIIDERQATPVTMMERLAGQLGLEGKFAKVLKRYKEAVRKQHDEQETLPELLLQRAPDFAGAVLEGIPIAGPVLREGAKVTASHLLDKHSATQKRREARQGDDPIEELTRAFVTELNHAADAKVPLNATWSKRQRRIILCFDTFELLAAEAVPWLLDHFLEADVSSNVVLVVAGRDRIDQALPSAVTRWLPYRDHGTIYPLALDRFTESETLDYLRSRGITDPVQTQTIWHLSRGLPLYLGLLTSNSQGEIDPTKTVVANFLRWIPEQEHVKRQLALDGALLSRPFNQDDLAAFTYVPEPDRPALSLWLTEQPFVRSIPQDGRYLYHELAQELFSRHLYQRSQRDYYATRRVLADYYQALLAQAQEDESESALTREKRGRTIFRSPQWVELAMARASQLFLLPEHASHISAVELVLSAYEYSVYTGEIIRLLRSLSEERLANQMKRSSGNLVRLLLRYIEADPPHEQRELLEAADALLRAVADDPAFPPQLLAHLYRKRGFAYKRHLKANEQAIADYNRAIELDPTYTRAYASRGTAYMSVGSYEQALQDFEHALELRPNYVWALAERAIIYQSRGADDRALSDFHRALELDPDSAWVYSLRGLVYLEQRDTVRAEADYSRSWELDPARVNSGWRAVWAAMCREGNTPEKMTQLESIAEVDSQHYAAFVCRGVVGYLREDFATARTQLEQASRLEPEAWDACFWNGMVRASLGQHGEAKAAIEKAMALGMPPVLLAPLHWLEQKQPDFYEEDVLPMLTGFAAQANSRSSNLQEEIH